MEQYADKNIPETPKIPNAVIADNEKTMAVCAHAGGIFFGFLPALIIWLMKKDENSYLTQQAKEALNFQITIGIAFFICFILVFVLIGALLILLVWLADIVFSVFAAIKAHNGESYRYPIAIRLIR